MRGIMRQAGAMMDERVCLTRPAYFPMDGKWHENSQQPTDAEVKRAIEDTCALEAAVENDQGSMG